MNKWIVHADDFGETEEITKGIIAAMQAGSVTSTSIMANMPGTDFGLNAASNWDGPHSFGVHINLCEDFPLTDVPTLSNDEGRFLKKRALFLRSISGRLSAVDLEKEITAQVDRIASSGIRISHFDSHKHLHQLPVVRSVVAKVALKFSVERIRVTREAKMWNVDAAFLNSLSGFVRNYLAKSAADVFESHRLRYPELIIDVKQLMNGIAGKPVDFEPLRDGAVAEVFCHPGTELADAQKPGSCKRYMELEYLLSDRFKDLCNRQSIQLVNYWEV